MLARTLTFADASSRDSAWWQVTISSSVPFAGDHAFAELTFEFSTETSKPTQADVRNNFISSVIEQRDPLQRNISIAVQKSPAS
jgi:hypothetical protein